MCNKFHGSIISGLLIPQYRRKLRIVVFALQFNVFPWKPHQVRWTLMNVVVLKLSWKIKAIKVLE